MATRDLDIHSISFGEDGLAIAFMELPSDVRVGGRVIQTRQVQLHASHPDYADDMAALRDLARRVLSSALDDFETSAPFVPDVEDEDDERGMGET
jgi:hypothetical protein